MFLKVQPFLFLLEQMLNLESRLSMWVLCQISWSPIGAIMGAALVMWMMAIIPYALAFAAGAMIFVVTEELIPESQANGNTDMATLGLMVGFVVMLVMDVALG